MKNFAKPIIVSFILCVIVLLYKMPLGTMVGNQNIKFESSYTVDRDDLQDLKLKTVRITSVADGDTASYSGGRIRFLDIDTPELAHPESFIRLECYGRDAKSRLESLIQGREVLVAASGRQERDKYDRELAYIFVPLGNDKLVFVNGYMVAHGFARVFSLQKDTKYSGLLRELEKSAIAKSEGLWGACDREKFRW